MESHWGYWWGLLWGQNLDRSWGRHLDEPRGFLLGHWTEQQKDQQMEIQWEIHWEMPMVRRWGCHWVIQRGRELVH